MRLAVMQPYLFPYLGYFQLIHASDKFVFYDDVAFIRNGWINRNRLLLNGSAHYFTVPLSGASSFVVIKDTRFAAREPRWKRKLLGSFELAYRNARFFPEGMQLLDGVLSLDTDCIATLARESVEAVARYVGLERDIVASSQVYSNSELKGSRRVLDICRQEHATTYINAPGGRGLYQEEEFRREGVELRFLSGQLPEYSQGGEAFVPGLSILDIVMRCDGATIQGMLAQYELKTSADFPTPALTGN